MFQIIILEDRYCGSYCGGEWVAIANHEDIEDDIGERGKWIKNIMEIDAPDCYQLWKKAHQYNWWAAGNHPTQAVEILKMNLER